MLKNSSNCKWKNGAADPTYTFTIGKAPLTVTAKAASVIYGDAAANDGVTYSGFVNGETAAVLGGTLTYAYKVTGTDTDYTTASPAGSYDIIPSGLTSDNYEITFVKGTLTVGKAEYTGTKTATGVTLDLDGHIVTVPGVTVLGTGLVLDGSEQGDGKLITDTAEDFIYSPSDDVPASVNVSDFSNKRVLPVWDGSGYIFCGVEKIGTAWETDQTKFKFTLYSDKINTILASGSGINVGICLDYTKGESHTKDYLIDAKTVSDYVEAGANKNHI